MHRRARVVHSRPEPVPHRPAHHRHAGIGARDSRLGADDRRPLKGQGYTTGQFGKNHLGDRDKHLPTAHGFDEFFGNLYHLNAEEEPETYYYPKDPEFRKKYGPRGVLHSYANGAIEDTGPLTQKRMETVDQEIYAAAGKFLDNAVNEKKPFSSGSIPPGCTSGPT